MAFKLPNNIEQFNIKDVTIAGDECILVTPKDIGVDWDDDNKYFRSSIWRKSDMYPVSLGFRKFMNYGEKPSFESISEGTKFKAIRKIDGSCLIVSKYKGELIIRTRGTVDASALQNGNEISILRQKYPHAFDNHYISRGRYTLLFEWTTPSNRIVLNETTEPSLWLIGMISHRDEDENKFYNYKDQYYLDLVAEFLEVKRPETFEVDITNVEELKQTIESLKDIEGVVIYDATGQILKKIKTLRYLQLHRVFTGIKSLKHILKLWKEYEYVSREEFENSLANNFDWELVISLKGLLDELFNKWAVVKAKLEDIRKFVDEHKGLSRKEIAGKILTQYGEWSSIAFDTLDGRSSKIEKMFELLENDN